MSLQYPTFEIVTAAQTIGSQMSWAPVTLLVETDLLPGTDRFRLEFSGVPELSFEMEETLSLSLGYGEENLQIIKGPVSRISKTLTTVTVEGMSPLTKLTDFRLAQAYEGQKAGEIVSDLCSAAGVETGTVEPGVAFPHYYLDRDKNALEQIHDLARKNGFVCFMNPEGKLHFGKAAGTQHQLTYGENLLSFVQISVQKPYSGVRVFGESPAGTEGDEAASWLTRNEDVVKGEAGDMSGPVLYITDESLRTQEASSIRAEAEFARLEKGTLTGRLTMLGNPALIPGDTLKITGAPGISPDRGLMITRVSHALSPAGGFVTTADFNEA